MRTTIAFVADSQVDERSRFPEHERVMDAFADIVAEARPTVVMHGGDVYERKSTERERDAVYRWVGLCAEFAPVVICGGNHEAAGEVSEIGRWFRDAGLDGVHAHETPEVYAVGRIDGADTPEGLPVSGAVLVAVLPWPRRSALADWYRAETRRPASAAELDESARDQLRAILRGFAVQFARLDPSGTKPRVLLAHLAVDGYRVDADQPAVGEGMRVALDDLALADADAILLGHVHLPQEWEIIRADGVTVPVIYAGSPRRTAYARGETTPKGWVDLRFDGRRLLEWKRYPLPATPLVLLEADWTECPDGTHRLVYRAGAGLVHEETPLDAEIRLRYFVSADRAAAAKDAAEGEQMHYLACGASEVTLDPVVEPGCKARAPQVAALPAVADKVLMMRELRGDPAGAEEAAMVRGMVEEIEAEVKS